LQNGEKHYNMSYYYKVFESYWELYHKVTFDGPNRLIIINPNETDINVQEDIYSVYKEWALIDENIRWFNALTVVGGEQTIEGQFLDATFFLVNGWRIKPSPGSYTLNIDGNLFASDGGAISVPAEEVNNLPNNININTTTSVTVRKIEAGSDLTNVTSKLDILPVMDSKLDFLSTKVIQIENNTIAIELINSQIYDLLLNGSVTASLVPAQEAALNEIRLRIEELWAINGLSPNQLTVNQNSRSVGSINQTFTEDGNDVNINRD